jgi:benzoate membrane transport protein
VTQPGDRRAFAAGVVASLVGFAGSFAVVLSGLRGVGASSAEAASGLMALFLLMAIVSVGLALRTRMPVAIAWSTPGAALLATAGIPEGGFPAAVSAVLLRGVLLVLAGLWRPLGALVDRIPAPIAAAMLAGVLLPLCLEPARAIGPVPELALPVIAVWAVLLRYARPWAVPVALVVAVAAVLLTHDLDLGPASSLAPTLTFTAPRFDLATTVGLGVPLFIVTMASQNVTGMTVLAGFGYRPPWRDVLRATGGATVLGAAFGAHAINLAAITAALVAGPEAHADHQRRWIAAVGGGVAYLVLGLCAAAATTFLAASPPELLGTVAGLALLAALGPALAGAVADPAVREAALVTFVVSASGATLIGVSSSFWGLVAGIAFLGIQRAGLGPTPGSPPSRATARPRTAGHA